MGRAGRGQVVLAGRSTPTDQVWLLRPAGRALLDGLSDCRRPGDPALALYLPVLGTLVPHWAADPAFPRCRPAGRARRGDVAGSGLAIARTLGGHFRHLPGGAAHASSRTCRTGSW
jgi:hypothetical protein